MSSRRSPRTRALAVLSALACVLHVEMAAAEWRYRERTARAVEESRRLMDEWLGVTPASMPSFERLPWLTADPAMEIESIVAYQVAERYWTPSASEPAVSRGLAWYMQSRVVEHLFNLRYARPGHSTESVRLFGGYIPLALPSLQISRWSTLDAIDDGPRLPHGIDAAALRSATAFATLERYLTWPVFQGALAVLARHRDTPLTSNHVGDVISAAAGQDLTWFFEIAFDPNRHIEYRLQHFSTEPATSGCMPRCYRTTVVASRVGDTPFTGSSQPRVGHFDSGSALIVEVRFADGQTVRASWDGRDERKEFVFVSPAPASIAQLDPDGFLLLDPDELDHRLTQEPGTNVPLVKWVARWATWLQHAMLTYTMFV